MTNRRHPPGTPHQENHRQTGDTVRGNILKSQAARQESSFINNNFRIVRTIQNVINKAAQIFSLSTRHNQD
jgi:hypothetical protein